MHEIKQLEQLVKERKAAEIKGLIQSFQYGVFFGAVINSFAEKGDDDSIGFIHKNVCLASGIEGFAKGGYKAKVYELINQGANLHDALTGFAKAGNYLEVNHLVKRIKLRFYRCLDIRNQYEIAGLLKPEKLLETLSCCDNYELRYYLLWEAKMSKEIIKTPDEERLFRLAAKLNNFMHTNGFTFEQAYNYARSFKSFSLFQGLQLFSLTKLFPEKPGFPYEIFLCILKHLIRTSKRDAHSFFNVAYKSRESISVIDKTYSTENTDTQILSSLIDKIYKFFKNHRIFLRQILILDDESLRFYYQANTASSHFEFHEKMKELLPDIDISIFVKRKASEYEPGLHIYEVSKDGTMQLKNFFFSPVKDPMETDCNDGLNFTI